VSIHIEGLKKRFGSTLVLDNINLEVQEREFLGLLGPVGFGKDNPAARPSWTRIR
jgi:ABC-type sugar transport system ATPase subunit